MAHAGSANSGADAGRLYDPLAAEMGQEALYKDVENIAMPLPNRQLT